ncbi:AAA family ATPase [bacterium]|nr:AAA family ATPase [bacterium]
MSDTRILHAALFTPGPRHVWGMPIRLIGGPGTAKSDLVTQTCLAAGLPVEVVIASLRDPTDFLGLPVPGPDGQVTYATPDWAVAAAKAKNAVVFLDEISCTAPATQAALLRVVLDRVVGGFQLPSGVRIVAAQNGVDEAAGGYDLAMPLANRFGTLADWQAPNAQAWGSWLLGAGNGGEVEATLDPEEEQKRVMALWPNAYAKAAGCISAFIAARPGLLHAQPAAGSPQASLPWPSRRTWAMATRALAASEIHHLDEAETDRYVGSFVGMTAMVELRSWLANLDLPDPAALLDGKVTFSHNRDRCDRTIAILSACAAMVAPKTAEKREPRAAAMWALLAQHMDQPDVCYTAVQALCNRETLLVRIGGKVNQDAERVLERFNPVLRAAGIVGR